MAASSRLAVPCTGALLCGNEASESSEVLRGSAITRSPTAWAQLRTRAMSAGWKAGSPGSYSGARKSSRRTPRAALSDDKFGGGMRDVTDEVKAEVAASGGQRGSGLQESLDAVAKVAPEPIKGLAQDAAAAHSPEAKARGAKLHDFCLGIPYGAFLALGGVVWFFYAGSRGALMFGFLAGVAILASSWLSFQTWKKGKSSSAFTATSTVLSFVVAAREARRFGLSGAFFPTGITAAVSFSMAVFFLYVILAGGNKPKKSKKAVA